MRIYLRRYFTQIRFPNIPFNNDGCYIHRSNRKQIFNNLLESRRDNFIMAIENYLESIANKDYDFLNDICEPTLYNKIKTNLEQIDNNIILNKGDILDLRIQNINLNFSANLDRSLNEDIQLIYSNSPNDSFHLNIYGDNKDGNNLFNLSTITNMNKNLANNDKAGVISRFILTYKTSSQFYSSNDKPTDNNVDNIEHSIIFDSVCSFQDLLQNTLNNNSFFGLATLFTNTNTQKKVTEIIDAMLTDWYITDSDNFMNGNNLIKNN